MLYNVPPPSTNGDPAVIKDVADREGPPQSFYQLQINCARAAELAIRDGYKLIEVEVRLMCDVCVVSYYNTYVNYHIISDISAVVSMHISTLSYV